MDEGRVVRERGDPGDAQHRVGTQRHQNRPAAPQGQDLGPRKAVDVKVLLCLAAKSKICSHFPYRTRGVFGRPLCFFSLRVRTDLLLILTFLIFLTL